MIECLSTTLHSHILIPHDFHIAPLLQPYIFFWKEVFLYVRSSHAHCLTKTMESNIFQYSSYACLTNQFCTATPLIL